MSKVPNCTLRPRAASGALLERNSDNADRSITRCFEQRGSVGNASRCNRAGDALQRHVPRPDGRRARRHVVRLGFRPAIR